MNCRASVERKLHSEQELEQVLNEYAIATCKYVEALKQFFKENPEKKVYYIDNHYTGNKCRYAQLKQGEDGLSYSIETKCMCDWD